MFSFKKKKEERKAKEEAIRESRRAFLKKATLATAGLMLTPTVSAIANNLTTDEKNKNEELNFVPLEKPDFLPQNAYDDLNSILNKMEAQVKKGVPFKDLHKKIGKFSALVPNKDSKSKHCNEVYEYVVKTILSNSDKFRFTKGKLRLSDNKVLSENTYNAQKQLKDCIDTPYTIIDMEADTNILLEFEHGKTTTAKDANRSIEETAKTIAKLYNGLHKSFAYNKPEGKEKQHTVYYNENDDLEWGSFKTGYDEKLPPELICKATLEFSGESERIEKTALNMKLAYERTERFNTLISRELYSLGNVELGYTYKKRAAEYKRKAVSTSSKISKNKSKPGSVKYDFNNDELEKFLTPGDKNKEHSRKVILSVPISQRSSAAKQIKSDKILPLYTQFPKSKGDYKFNFYNEEYKIKFDKYHGSIIKPMNKIFDWEDEDKKLVQEEIARISTQGGKAYHTNNYKKSGLQKPR